MKNKINFIFFSFYFNQIQSPRKKNPQDSGMSFQSSKSPHALSLNVLLVKKTYTITKGVSFNPYERIKIIGYLIFVPEKAYQILDKRNCNEIYDETICCYDFNVYDRFIMSYNFMLDGKNSSSDQKNSSLDIKFDRIMQGDFTDFEKLKTNSNKPIFYDVLEHNCHFVNLKTDYVRLIFKYKNYKVYQTSSNNITYKPIQSFDLKINMITIALTSNIFNLNTFRKAYKR